MTFRDATNGFPANGRLRYEFRNSILMTCNYPDLGAASDLVMQIFNQSKARTRSEL